MSYNEIPNIIVDCVTLPNKPLSNREIIYAAKRLSMNGFKRVFLRDILPTKTKVTECGIVNIDSSSGDGIHWVMFSKMARISPISIVMVCSLLVSWLHI